MSYTFWAIPMSISNGSSWERGRQGNSYSVQVAFGSSTFSLKHSCVTVEIVKPKVVSHKLGRLELPPSPFPPSERSWYSWPWEKAKEEKDYVVFLFFSFFYIYIYFLLVFNLPTYRITPSVHPISAPLSACHPVTPTPRPPPLPPPLVRFPELGDFHVLSPFLIFPTDFSPFPFIPFH